MKQKVKSYFFGLFAEYWVIFLFFFKGYILLKHRYKTKFGEIDLIFKKSNKIIAIEVKARSNKNIKLNEVVSKNQIHRIKNTLNFFLIKNKNYHNYDYTIDLVLVYKNLFFKHIKDIEY